MLFLKRTLVAIFFISFISTNSNAEPGNIQRWLMDTPTSLWTFGMSELRDNVSKAFTQGLMLPNTEERIEVTSGTAHYDWDKNRIIISANVSLKRDYDADTCEGLLSAMRAHGLVLDGEVPDPLSASNYSQAFLRGFSDGSEPTNYVQKMDEIIKLSVSFRDGHCQGPLLSTDAFHKTQ